MRGGLAAEAKVECFVEKRYRGASGLRRVASPAK